MRSQGMWGHHDGLSILRLAKGRVLALAVVLGVLACRPSDDFVRAGNAHRRGQYEDAITYYGRVVARGNEREVRSAHIMRGSVLEELGRDAAAAVEYDRALSLDPGCRTALLCKGRLLARLGQLAKAFDVLSSALAVPGMHDFEFREERARVLMALGRLDEASQDVDALRRVALESREVHIDDAPAEVEAALRQARDDAVDGPVQAAIRR